MTIDLEGAPGLKQAFVRLHDKYDGAADQFPLDYLHSDRPGSPGFRKAIAENVRKTYEEKGGPVFRLDISFVTDEGYSSATMDTLALWLNEADRCGTGAESGGVDNWPDGKYRNVRFSPMIRPSDKENTYVVEIRCRIKTQTN